MMMLRSALRTGKGRALLVALLLILAWQAWLSLAAPGKIAPVVGQEPGPKVNLQVTLAFAPERFHVLAFQKFGRVTGTENNTVELRGVNKSDLLSVARPHWVIALNPLPKEGD